MSEEMPQTDGASRCTGGYHKGCRCPECKNVNKQRSDAWRAKNPAKVRTQAARAYASYQSKTKAQATKKPGTRWTKEEITLALREDLTLQEIAIQLGRSYSSVQKMRQHLRNPDAAKAKRARPPSTQEVTKHGVTGYSRGCRCEVCREEKREYEQEQHRKRVEAAASGEATFDHGYGGYTRWGCRCEVCRGAKAEYQAGRGRGADAKGYMKEYRKARREAIAKGRQIVIKHGLGGYSNDGCRCETCVEAYRSYRAENRDKQYHVTHPEAAADANRRTVSKWQAETLEGATRYGLQWTGPELEIAARSDLTAKEAALMLGRTYAAVKNVRKKLVHDPKAINLAGIPESAGPVRPDEEPTP